MPESNQLETLRRKRDQNWELAGLARQDGDKEAEEKYTNEARRLSREIGNIVRLTK